MANLPRWESSRIIPGIKPELMARRNFESLAGVLNHYRQEIEYSTSRITSLETSTADYLEPALLGGGSIWDIRHFGTLDKAIAVIGSSDATLYITRTISVTANVVVPSNIAVVVLKGGLFNISTGISLRFSGSFQAGHDRAFTGEGLPIFGEGSVESICVIWFGAKSLTDSTAAIQKAIDSAVASHVYFSRKVRIPTGYYFITGRLTIDINAIWLCGDGQQASRLAFDVNTTLTFTGDTSVVAGDIGKTVRSTTVILQMSSTGHTVSPNTDIGKQVQNGTGATGILVRRGLSAAHPFFEVRVTAGAFANGDNVTIPTGTGAGTIDTAPITVVNEGVLQSFTTAGNDTWTIKGAAGYFWRGATVSVVSGSGASGTLSADGVDDAESVIAISPDGVHLREFTKITDLGFDCVNASKSIAIDMSSSPNTTIRDCFGTNFWDGIRGGACWNSKLEACRFFLNRHYGMDLSANSNAMLLDTCSVTCAEGPGTRDLFIESSKGVTVMGGAYEDAEWAVEIQASQVIWSGYSVESCTDGPFAITGNDSLLKYLGGLIFNPGVVAVFKSTASDAFIDIDTLKLETPTLNPSKVFILSGSASAAFTKIKADETRYEEGGADFYTVATGTVKAKTNSNIFTNSYDSTAHCVEIRALTNAFGLYLTNTLGNGGYGAKSGNNKINDGSEPVYEGRDISDELLFRVNSGGLTELRQPVLGTEILSLKTQATNDDIEELAYQNRVATTDATVTTLHAFTIPASTTYTIKAMVNARRTGGAAGTAEDGGSYDMLATYKNVAGVATLIGAAAITANEDQAGWDCIFDVIGDAARIRVIGAASNNVTWHMTARVYAVGS